MQPKSSTQQTGLNHDMHAARRFDRFVLAVLALLGMNAHAHVYVDVDATGALRFSDVRETATQALYIEEPQPAPPDATTPAATTNVPAYVAMAARRHGLDAGLLNAIIRVESGFRHDALSPRGAMGLMQLMPATARELGVANAYDPRANIDAGALHFRRLLDRFRDPQLALAAYNAGAATVERYGNAVPPYPETIEFVRRVQRYWRGAYAAAQGGFAP